MFLAWQPSTWPKAPAAVDEQFILTLKTLFEDAILAEIINVIEDARHRTGSLEHRGHVVAIALMCAVDAVASYGYRNKHVRDFIANHFPSEYQAHAAQSWHTHRSIGFSIAATCSGGLVWNGHLVLHRLPGNRHIPGRRPRRWDALAVFVVGVMLFNIGCGGNGTAETPASVPTATSLTTSSTSISWGSDVNLTAQVNASTGSATPSGTVTFYDGTAVLGTAPVANGTAYSTRALTVGPHTLTATYSGDSAYLASSSTGASVNVTFTATIAVAATDEAQNASSADLTVNIQ